MANKADSNTTVDRRKALQIGAAAGVTAAVWGGPQIGRLGSAPAYAAHCSPAKTQDLESGFESMNQGNGNCGTFASANNAFNQLAGDGLTTTVSNPCFDGAGGVSVSGALGTGSCKLTLLITDGPNGPVIASPSVTFSGSGGFVAFPVINDGAYPSSKVKLRIQCGPAECLH